MDILKPTVKNLTTVSNVVTLTNQTMQENESKICKKIKNIPEKCALCHGDHPANYKGCTTYKDLIN